ncbi:MAG: hypothetical protein ACT4PL_05200 [Phycisphaerales bacterium]
MSDQFPLPTPEELAALALGDTMPADLLARAAKAPVAAEITRIRGILATLRRDDGVDPSPALVRVLRERLRRTSSVRAWLGGLPQLVMDVVYDSRRQVGLVGFRGGLGDGETVTIALSARPPADLHLDLQIQREQREGADGRWTISGQIDPPRAFGPREVAVGLARGADGPVEVETEADEAGRFVLVADEPGEWSLLVRDGPTTVRVDDIRLS